MPSGDSDVPRNRISAGRSAKWNVSIDALLHRPIQIDQQVAAGDQIEVRERRILDDVVMREQHQLAQLAADAVAAGLAAGKTGAGAPRTRRRLPRRVQALARHGDRLLVEVGGEHLDRRRASAVAACSASSIATEYASSPVAQPATQTRIWSCGPLFWNSRGIDPCSSASQAAGSRKKFVTLISSSFISATASCGSSRMNRA